MTEHKSRVNCLHILAAGGTRLIGARLVTQLESAGHAVRVLDIRASGDSRGDVRDLDSVTKSAS